MGLSGVQRGRASVDCSHSASWLREWGLEGGLQGLDVRQEEVG